MKIAINTKVDYKPAKNDLAAFHSLASEFENVDLSIEELAQRIASGFPFCAQHDGRRNANNFIASDYLAVDIDDGMSIAEAMSFPYVQRYAAIVYETPSSTPEHNRFRIIFPLARTITTRDEMEQAYTGAVRKFHGDGACKDACRLFYGNKGCTPFVLNNILPDEMLGELMILGAQKRVSAEAHREEVTNQVAAQRAKLTLRPEQEIQTAYGKILKTNDLEKGTVVFCPVHLDKHPSAFITQSRTGTKGVYCSTCTTTFWPLEMHTKSTGDYDFYAIDNDLHHIEYEEDPWNSYGSETPEEFFSDASRVVRSLNSKFLPRLNFAEGVTLVRSPKGSGKSENIARYVRECKQKNLSVLLIGHRQALLSALAKRLGLDCYLEHRHFVSRHFAVSLDSMPRMLDLQRNKFDVIIIDEVEQVLAHMASDTLHRNRRKCFLMLERYLARAQAVLACDADLGYLSLSTISKARGGELPVKFYINRFKEKERTVELYKSENQLLAELVQNIKRGGRYYVCSNSKKKAEEIHQVITNLGERIRTVLITSDNSKSPEIRGFLDDIVEKSESYDVIIASPSVGTGIDISFPDGEQRITGVYGFFGARINSHFEIDQQLSRVRNPEYIKVWVSPERFSFEVEPDAIQRSLVELGLIPDVQESYDDDDTIIFEDEDPLLNLIAEVLSLNRASKNNLKQNFTDLKLYNGWNVVSVDTDEVTSVLGGQARKLARDALASAKAAELCNAAKLSHAEVMLLAKSRVPTIAETLSLERYALETFYGEEISEEIVRFDESGRMREKIQRLAEYLQVTLVVEKTGILPVIKDAGSLLWHLFRCATLTDASGQLIKGRLVQADSLKDFAALCAVRKLEIETLLGISLRRDLQTKPMAQLGEFFRSVGLAWGPSKKRDVAGVRFYSYQIDFSRYSVLKKYALRFCRV